MKVLFVCLGNICRSPAGEGIFQKMVEEAGLSEKFTIESAGTSGAHDGERADARMRAAAERRGYSLESRSRKFVEEDFEKFDLILPMDKSNQRNILFMSSGRYDDKVKLMLDYSSNHKGEEVPDPYYGGESGFDWVIDLLEDSCKNLLKDLKN